MDKFKSNGATSSQLGLAKSYIYKLTGANWLEHKTVSQSELKTELQSIDCKIERRLKS